jgi:ornithine cyclodeaminase/alanine dehydrogenase-like protein (mu-crystallin family)
MAAPVAILAKPEDHRGILTMEEAVNAMIDAFRNWASDPLVAELRRRTHTPKNVRITLHQGAAPAYGTTGIMTHAELVRIFGDKQKYPRRGRPVLVLYDSDTAALKLILVGEMHPRELPDANSVVAMPTACASMVGTDLLARKDCRVAGIFGAGDQARLHLLALTCIRKSIDKVCVFSPTRENREKFAAEMSAVLGIEVSAADSAAAVVDGADVIVCATNSNVPVFDSNWLISRPARDLDRLEQYWIKKARLYKPNAPRDRRTDLGARRYFDDQCLGTGRTGQDSGVLGSLARSSKHRAQDRRRRRGHPR